MKDKIESFLKKVEDKGNEKEQYIRVYKNPSKLGAIIGFIWSLLVLIVCIFLLLHSFLGIIITIIDLIIVVYYGSNVFSKKGIALYKTVKVDEKNHKE